MPEADGREAVGDTSSTADSVTTAPERDSHKLKSFMAAMLGVIAVICILAGILGFWTFRTATDSDRFERKAEELLRTEEVSDALARRVVNEVAVALDLRERVNEYVPAVVQPITDVLLAGVRTRVEVRVGELIRTDEVSESIGAAVGRAHAAAIDVLEGDDVVDGVTIEDGDVRINLLPLTTRALGALQEIGLFGDVTLPEIDRAGDPDVQRAELEAALGRDLPDDFGEPVVFQSDALDELGANVQMLRDLLLLARRIFWLLLLVGAAFAAGSMWLSRDRWRTAGLIVAGFFVGALAVRLVGSAASERLPEAVEDSGAKATVSDIVAGLESSLNRTLTTIAVIALIGLIVAAWAVHGHPEWMRRRSGDASSQVSGE